MGCEVVVKQLLNRYYSTKGLERPGTAPELIWNGFLFEMRSKAFQVTSSNVPKRSRHTYRCNMENRISLHSFSSKCNLAKSTVYRKCEELRIPTSNGLSPDDCDRLKSAFGLYNPGIPTPEEPAIEQSAEVQVEVGNHKIVLTTPQLPQTYSLEGLRESQVVQFEDPLAIAQQVLTAVDSVIAGMGQDIKTRQERLDETRRANEAISAKRQQLEMEARLYRLQTTQIDTETSQQTQSLNTSLSALQSLGKPVVGGSASE